MNTICVWQHDGLAVACKAARELALSIDKSGSFLRGGELHMTPMPVWDSPDGEGPPYVEQCEHTLFPHIACTGRPWVQRPFVMTTPIFKHFLFINLLGHVS